MSDNINSSEIFSLSFHTFKDNLFSFVFLAVLFICLTFTITYYFIPEDIESVSAIQAVLLIALLFITYVKLAVSVHRVTLLNENGLNNFWQFKLCDIKFFLAMMALIVVFGLVAWVSIYLSALATNKNIFLITALSLFIVLGLIGSRLAMAFPALAIGQDTSIKTIWDAGKNHKATLFFLVIVFPYLTGRLLNKLPANDLQMELLSSTISTIVVIFEVILISHCFDQFVAQDKATDQVVEAL